jgi:hypothetical protein
MKTKAESYVIVDFEARELTQLPSLKDALHALDGYAKDGHPSVAVIRGTIAKYSLKPIIEDAPSPKRTRKPRAIPNVEASLVSPDKPKRGRPRKVAEPANGTSTAEASQR